MQTGITEIRLARRISRNLRPNALELPTPNVFQILPLRSSRRCLVQINRYPVSLPDFRSDVPRHGHAILDGHAINRNKRDHVSRPHPRMCALMLIQIDQLSSLAYAANRRFLDRLAFAPARTAPDPQLALAGGWRRRGGHTVHGLAADLEPCLP